MPVNHYFNNYPNKYSQEQALVEDLLVESIKMYGQDCYYIVRESITGSVQDLIYGEDPTAKFSRYYKMEMYLNNVMDHASGGDFLSKFGLQVSEGASFLMSRRTFTRYVPSQIAIRPREGDLIYHPLSTNLYEIKYVEHENNFYTLGRDARLPYMYEMRCELFVYSQEEIETGVPEIDAVENEGAYIIELAMNPTSGSNNYIIGEIVYQGNTFNSTVTQAQTVDWNPITKILQIKNIRGIFANNSGVRGVSSNTYYQIAGYDDLQDNSENDSFQNQEMETEKDIFIITTENDPFGVA